MSETRIPATPPLLTVAGVTRRFGALAAADDLNLAVLPGEIHALIGPNGAGKTTTCALISGELAADEGRIGFDGRDVTAEGVVARARRGLVRAYQVVALFPTLTARETIEVALIAPTRSVWRPFAARDRDRRLADSAGEVLRRFGLDPDDRRPAAVLSHGERRRLEIALAAARRPRLLLLDEPLAGLGPEESAAMVETIRTLAADATILMVEHDMEAVFALAGRVTVLVAGHAIATGTPDAIRADARVIKAYLGEDDAG
ncbi:ABC transporter ATP-binding protein [Tistrella bauzanensis]|uniref:ABC transporter ATP-binding protein n=1 Tax=Tistrella bauzanensis TaxID=657419 RepID=A0ABQ1IMA8_9PROT|nr:ABC transporter ATP-binding protein [Tistrella bauzanensis]GGB47204.1 ABC transporter ATP-binding protein [Tistrella bauzanensis]